MNKSTIVCKCEEVSISDIESAINMGAHTFDDVKKLTRCGMGFCQAKMCMNPVRNIISEKTKQPLNQLEPSRMRAPLSVIRMRALASKEATSIASVFREYNREG